MNYLRTAAKLMKSFHLPSGVLGNCKTLPNKMLGLGPGIFLTTAKAWYLKDTAIVTNTTTATNVDKANIKNMIAPSGGKIEIHFQFLISDILKRNNYF